MNTSRVLLRFFLLFAACGALACGQTAPAQPAVSPNHVTFFTEPNFKGDSLIIEAGASVPNLETMTRPDGQPWLFAISSVEVAGTARASVYNTANFSGPRLDITTNISDLYSVQRADQPGATWDKAIAAITVTGAQPVIVAQPAPTVAQPAPTVVQTAPVVTQPAPVIVQTAPQTPATVVIVPQRGPPPPPVVREVRPRIDPRTVDLMVYRAYREVLNRAPDPEGLRTYRQRIIYEGWSERQIIEQLQRSSEARSVNADAAITQAYREVLGRDPDANGLAHYRAKWRDGWTQGQIRDDLRRSAEGRDGHIRTAITRAYRDLLGRDPDPSGYATYERAMRERGYTERDVRAAIMSGDEYRQKHPRGR